MFHSKSVGPSYFETRAHILASCLRILSKRNSILNSILHTIQLNSFISTGKYSITHETFHFNLRNVSINTLSSDSNSLLWKCSDFLTTYRVQRINLLQTTQNSINNSQYPNISYWILKIMKWLSSACLFTFWIKSSLETTASTWPSHCTTCSDIAKFPSRMWMVFFR